MHHAYLGGAGLTRQGDREQQPMPSQENVHGQMGPGEAAQRRTGSLRATGPGNQIFETIRHAQPNKGGLATKTSGGRLRSEAPGSVLDQSNHSGGHHSRGAATVASVASADDDDWSFEDDEDDGLPTVRPEHGHHGAPTIVASDKSRTLNEELDNERESEHPAEADAEAGADEAEIAMDDMMLDSVIIPALDAVSLYPSARQKSRDSDDPPLLAIVTRSQQCRSTMSRSATTCLGGSGAYDSRCLVRAGGRDHGRCRAGRSAAMNERRSPSKRDSFRLHRKIRGRLRPKYDYTT